MVNEVNKNMSAKGQICLNRGRVTGNPVSREVKTRERKDKDKGRKVGGTRN